METFSVFLKACLFATVIFVSHATVHAEEEYAGRKVISRSSASCAAGFVNFKQDAFAYLNITVIGTDLMDDENQCGFACLESSSCFSYNVAAFPDINERFVCELLPSDKYNNSEEFVQHNFFHHFSVASPCSSGPCKNKGKCVSLYEENSYVCVCKEGFTGKNCEKNVNYCYNNPCLNNGTCTNQINGFNCSCVPGFIGPRCEIDNASECVTNPCVNNGTCLNRFNYYYCICAPGFVGRQCEREISRDWQNRIPRESNDAGFQRNSTIISGNESYIGNLTAFLAPVVGFGYRWLLCYRASTHGWNVSHFHSRCDGKADTVTIIQVGQYIFGGYTDIPWDSTSGGRFRFSFRAFVFSLHNKEDLPPFKSSVTDPSKAIYSGSQYGPSFGVNDILIADEANSNNNSYSNFGQSYSVPGGVGNRFTVLAGTMLFTPYDWEVFYLD